MVLAVAVVVLGILYAVRVAFRGKAHFDRVDRQGNGLLLSKNLMEMAYWGLQPFGRLIAHAQITPNQITYLSLVLGFFAGLCFAFGHFGSGATLAALSALLDALDGLVARMTGRASRAGEILDSAADRYVEFFLFGGLIVYYRQVFAMEALTLLAFLGSYMVSYSSMLARAEKIELSPLRSTMRRPERMFYLILGAALAPVTIPWLETSGEYPIAIGYSVAAALGLIAVFANFTAIEQFWQTFKGLRSQNCPTPEGDATLEGDDAAEHPSPSLRR